MDRPVKMKSAILLGERQIEVNHKVPVPSAAPGEAVIKVRAALTCGTDLKAYRYGHELIPVPAPLGHEFSGDIYELGEGVRGFKVGDPVMGVYSASCGECHQCMMGRENLCEDALAHKANGAYAQFIKLPARVVQNGLFIKPDGLSYAEAAMLEPLACVVHGMDLTRRYNYNNVLVMGAGPVGLLHLMMQKKVGKTVVVSGRDGMRLKKARELGADTVVETNLEEMAWSIIEATAGAGVDLVIEATGSAEVWEASTRLVRKGGTVLLFGGCPPDSTACFDAGRLHYDEIHLIGAYHYKPSDVDIARDMLVSGEIDVKPLITGEYPLENIQDAFEELIKGNGVKYAIIP